MLQTTTLSNVVGGCNASLKNLILSEYMVFIVVILRLSIPIFNLYKLQPKMRRKKLAKKTPAKLHWLIATQRGKSIVTYKARVFFATGVVRANFEHQDSPPQKNEHQAKGAVVWVL